MPINKLFFKLIFVLILLATQLSFGQRKSLYLNFDISSKETFFKENGSGKTIKEFVYLKNKKSNGNIEFFIKDQKFLYNKSKMVKKIVDLKKLQKQQLLSANEVVKYVEKVRKKYPMWYRYPSKGYPRMYVVENYSNCKVILYEVNWKYYIE